MKTGLSEVGNFAYLTEMYAPKGKEYLRKRIVDAKLFIDQHFSENISIEAMAEKACFSKFHFIRLFTKSYGMTPHQYLTDLRIGKAKQLLRKGCTVSAALAATGFASMSSFNKLFKRHVHIIPSAYIQVNDPYVPDCFLEYMGWKE